MCQAEGAQVTSPHTIPGPESLMGVPVSPRIAAGFSLSWDPEGEDSGSSHLVPLHFTLCAFPFADCGLCPPVGITHGRALGVLTGDRWMWRVSWGP